MNSLRNDPFNLKTCVSGLCNRLIFMYSDLYEFAFYLLIKRSMKMYKHEFKNPFEPSMIEIDYLLESSDLIVKQCALAYQRILSSKNELNLRWGIDDLENLADPLMERELERFKPYCLYWKHSKSYRKLNLAVVRLFNEMIKSLYLYACAITAQSYKIPRVLLRQFDAPENESLKFLNEEDNTVDLLIKLITGLREDLKVYELLIENKGKPVKVVRIKKNVRNTAIARTA